MRVKHFDDRSTVARAGGSTLTSRRVHALRRGDPARHRGRSTSGGTPRRLLVVLSDGFAYDHGYEGRYGEADARHALVEARRRGVGASASVSARSPTRPRSDASSVRRPTPRARGKRLPA